MAVQSILFKKQYWTVKRAQKWLKEHGYTQLIVDITDNYLRFRQEDPDDFNKSSFRTITWKPSIKAIVGEYAVMKKRNNPRVLFAQDLEAGYTSKTEVSPETTLYYLKELTWLDEPEINESFTDWYDTRVHIEIGSITAKNVSDLPQNIQERGFYETSSKAVYNEKKLLEEAFYRGQLFDNPTKKEETMRNNPRYAIVDNDSNRILHKETDKDSAVLRLSSFKEIYPDAHLIVQEFPSGLIIAETSPYISSSPKVGDYYKNEYGLWKIIEHYDDDTWEIRGDRGDKVEFTSNLETYYTKVDDPFSKNPRRQDDFIQTAFHEIEEDGTEGAFTRYVANNFYGENTVEKRIAVAHEIKNAYEKWVEKGKKGKAPYTLKTYRRAVFYLNILPERDKRRNPNSNRHHPNVGNRKHTKSNPMPYWAQTIVQQMGGYGKLRMFLGIKQIIYNEKNKSVNFVFPNKKRSKANLVVVKLLPTDLYQMDFYRVGKKKSSDPVMASLGIKEEYKKHLESFEGLFWDQLIPTFEEETGLLLRF